MTRGMQRLFVLLMLVLGCVAGVARGADPPPEQFLRDVIQKRFSVPSVDGIAKLPYLDLYEVRIGKDLVYIDPKGEHLIIGNIIDARTGENLTRARVDELANAALPKFKFAELPFASAIKIVKGNGKRQLAVFADPNCVYCKRFEQIALAQTSDVTLYVFLLPILGPDSVEKVKTLWCASDRARAWQDWMVNGVMPSGPAAANCTSPGDRNVALARSLRVDATPTLLFANGKRVAGAIRGDELGRLLAQGN